MKLYKADFIASFFTLLIGLFIATIFTDNNIQSNLIIAFFVAICSLVFLGFHNEKILKNEGCNSVE